MSVNSEPNGMEHAKYVAAGNNEAEKARDTKDRAAVGRGFAKREPIRVESAVDEFAGTVIERKGTETANNLAELEKTRNDLSEISERNVNNSEAGKAIEHMRSIYAQEKERLQNILNELGSEENKRVNGVNARESLLILDIFEKDLTGLLKQLDPDSTQQDIFTLIDKQLQQLEVSRPYDHELAKRDRGEEVLRDRDIAYWKRFKENFLDLLSSEGQEK
jgi:hypothetical protein